MLKCSYGIVGFKVPLFAGLVAIALFGVSAGCGKRGPKLAEVTGKVTLDGQPVANALVTFVPVDGSITSAGFTDANGIYRLGCHLGEGAVIGQHRVSVRSQPSDQGGAAGASHDPDEFAYRAGPENGSPKVFVDPIPARYNDKSELVREVKAGKNVIDLELTSKP